VLAVTDLRAAIEALAGVECFPEDGFEGRLVHRAAVLDLIPEHTPHPGEPHQFRVECERCGEPGHLFVAILGPTEEARITERENPGAVLNHAIGEAIRTTPPKEKKR
jgi:hypothetical protein